MPAAEAIAPDARDKRNLYANNLPDDAMAEAFGRFGAALAPLQEAGKLGGVMFQYPTWFGPRRENRAEIEARLTGGVPPCG